MDPIELRPCRPPEVGVAMTQARGKKLGFVESQEKRSSELRHSFHDSEPFRLFAYGGWAPWADGLGTRYVGARFQAPASSREQAAGLGTPIYPGL